ncbi:unnamed protein product [Notodromas monacha]|uniref:Prokaryotic-type class I peptide chain release factors domain-containing protein n=1 Tax=Notodromas monacha TaxID=399045 RepID=A0A7R9BDJ7_9CRUS|nr:unnamed protein product [Notodromas monacha]CAG0913404.1 unnamed protein product [Notodromas monacha]
MGTFRVILRKYIFSLPSLNESKGFATTSCSNIRRDQLDFTNFPKLDDKDLEESFIKGGGPGGQKVNKSVNCVQLRHVPTGLIVKVHHSRFQHDNRKIARELLLERLDEHLNKDMSISNQKKRLLAEKSKRSSSKQSKFAKMKAMWKEREGIT